jgi:hypothetical protein
MINNKQTEVDIAELAHNAYPFSNSERNAFIAGYNKAKAMHKEEIIEFAINFTYGTKRVGESIKKRFYKIVQRNIWR